MRKYHRVEEAEPPCQRHGGQRGKAGQQRRAEKDSAQRRKIDPKLPVEPVGHEALHDESASECIEREQGTQLRDATLRLVQSVPGRRHEPAASDRIRAGRLDPPPQQRKDRGKRGAGCSVEPEQRAVALHRRPTPLLQAIRDPAAGQRPEGVGGEAEHVRPCEHPGAVLVADHLGQARLLNCQERSQFVTARA